MARIRTIKPEFWTDPLMVSLPYEVRLFYIGLWNFADDWGCLENEPLRLRLQVLPADPVDAEELVETLIRHGRLERLEDGGGTVFLHLAKFEEHQKVDKRSASKYGLPETWRKVASEQAPPDPAESRRIPPNSTPGKEGKGMEGKGMEGISAPSGDDAPSDVPDVLPSPRPRSRQPDPLWDALIEACEIDASRITKSARGAYNKAVSELRALGATPEEVAVAAEILRRTWKEGQITPTVLARRWPEIGATLRREMDVRRRKREEEDPYGRIYAAREPVPRPDDFADALEA
ncbi:MAG: hypothetical protein M0Z92_14560 [Actinomycetota bacterium]|nr:hypothetical protein [Actinomycetota bacterium]